MSLSTAEWFERGGGAFVVPPEELAGRLAHIRAFVFDWDGVFNPGIKGEGTHSHWSEADSMGQNLLRFGWWLRDGTLPVTAILTGQNNPSAAQLARREHFHAVYQGFLNKSVALDHLLDTYGLEPDQVAFVFDDALDLAVARRVGLRILVRRAASPLFQRHVVAQGCAEYVTGAEGGRHAVRETSELLLGLARAYDTVVDQRSTFSERYATYLAQRQAGVVRWFSASDQGVVEAGS